MSHSKWPAYLVVPNWIEASMSRSLAKLAFLAAALVAMGGWIWLLGIGVKWLVVKI
jgi:hypothetical protein